MLRSLLAVPVLATSHAASAACVIDRLRPMDTIPTIVAPGQTFMFLATNDCTMLHFSVSRTRFPRIEMSGW